MNQPAPGFPAHDLPADVALGVHELAERLHELLRPAMRELTPPPEISLLWQTAKMLNAAAGHLQFSQQTEAGLHFARWNEVAEIASSLADTALEVAAANLPSVQAAAAKVHDEDASAADAGEVMDCGGRVEVIGADYDRTQRTLTVTIGAAPDRPLSVTADRGPAPEPRPHTAASLLQTAHALRRLGAVVGPLVLEPAEDGVPMCGRANREVSCEVCGQIVGADAARYVQPAPPTGGYDPRAAEVCSVTCARAAHTGEHRP